MEAPKAELQGSPSSGRWANQLASPALPTCKSPGICSDCRCRFQHLDNDLLSPASKEKTDMEEQEGTRR